MNEKKLNELWKILSSATNINTLEYDEAVTIGNVFGQMRKTIEEQQQSIKELAKEAQYYHDLVSELQRN